MLSSGVFAGLAASVFWGVSDFLARLSTDRIGTRRTVFYIQLISLVGLSPFLLIPSLQPSWPSSTAVAIAMGIGVLNGAGALLLYRALETGVVSLVSPVSSTFSVVAAGLAVMAGERPSALQWAGLAAATVGVLAVAKTSDGSGSTHQSRRAILLAALAALAWGISFFSLKLVVRDLGPVFPAWISRGVAATVVGLACWLQGVSLAPPRGAVGWVVGVAVFDTLAFVAYNVGVSEALTSVVAVLASLYSLVTMALAAIFLRERLTRGQWASVIVVLCGVGAVSAP